MSQSDETSKDAQAKLDQLRHEAGGALTGPEVRKRWGMEGDGGLEDPPLDWRLTPRNVILQVAAVVLFGAVVWFIAMLAFDGVAALFSGAGDGA
ncbi:MAG: hypothetical protein AAF661_14295 [Pseudomonadota bacterium]